MRVKWLLALLFLVAALALPSAAEAAPPASGGFWHLVKYGETLASIGRHYGVPVDSIAAVNGIVNINRIWAGTYLWIPATHVPPTFPPGQTCRAKYTVKRGDTLSRIAAWYGVTVWRLAWNNGIKNVNRIYPGQRLCIPWAGVPK